MSEAKTPYTYNLFKDHTDVHHPFHGVFLMFSYQYILYQTIKRGRIYICMFISTNTYLH